MRSKCSHIEQVVAKIQTGNRIMLGGFGSSGTPFALIDELLNQGQKKLTIIKNDANETHVGVYKLVKAGQVNKIITSHIGLNPLVMELAQSNELDVELVPQGILAERIRCAGVGVEGFVSRIGRETPYADSRQKIEIQGELFLFEPAINADVALVHASVADEYGNLQFNTAGINFSPLMAMAARLTIAEAIQLLPIGKMDPQHVHLTGVVVNHVVKIHHPGQDYEPIKR